MEKVSQSGPELPYYMRTRSTLCSIGEKPAFLTSFKLEDKVVIFVLSDGQIQGHFNDSSVMIIDRNRELGVFFSPKQPKIPSIFKLSEEDEMETKNPSAYRRFEMLKQIVQ